MRSSIREEGGSVAFDIPARRHLFTFVVLTLWLAGWAVAEIRAIESLVPGSSRLSIHSPKSSAIDLYSLAGWTAFGLLAVYYWLWMAVGSESVTLDGVTLSIARRPFGVPRARKFEWQRVRNLRVDPIRSRRRPLMGLNRDPIGGVIAFDYGSRTYRFAEVDEAEAAMLIGELESRFGTRSAA